MNLNVNPFGRLVDEQGAPLPDSRKPLLRFNEPLSLSFAFPQGAVSPGDAFAFPQGAVSPGDAFTLAVDDNFLQGDELVALHETPAIDAKASTVAFAAIPATSRKLYRLTNGVPGLVQAHLQVIRYAGGDETAAQTVVDDTIFLRGVVYVKGATAVLLDPNAAYTKDETDALLSAAPEFQFSADGESWHSEQAEGDAYLRFRATSVANASWSQAVRFSLAGASGLTSVTVDGHDAIISGGTATIMTDAVEAMDAMPTASEANAGRVVLYSGTTTADYITGHQYRCDGGEGTEEYLHVVFDYPAGETPTWDVGGDYAYDIGAQTYGTPGEGVFFAFNLESDNCWKCYAQEGQPIYTRPQDSLDPNGEYTPCDPLASGTLTATQVTPRVYFWTDITPVQDDAITSVIVNGNTASVQGGTATVTVPISGGTVPISGGTVTNDTITITDGLTNTTFLGMGTVSVTGGVEIGRGISQGETEIPAATSAYTLSDGCFTQTPATAPTYTLPTVAADSRTHEIILTVKFSNVQTLAFVDSNGNTLTPQSTPTIAATSVITYLCRWSALASAWIIYPVVEVE